MTDVSFAGPPGLTPSEQAEVERKVEQTFADGDAVTGVIASLQADAGKAPDPINEGSSLITGSVDAETITEVVVVEAAAVVPVTAELVPHGIVHFAKVDFGTFCKSVGGVISNSTHGVTCDTCLRMIKHLRNLAAKDENVLQVFYRMRKKVIAYAQSFNKSNKERQMDWPTVRMAARSVSMPEFIVGNMCDKNPMQLTYIDEPKNRPQPSLPELFIEVRTA